MCYLLSSKINTIHLGQCVEVLALVQYKYCSSSQHKLKQIMCKTEARCLIAGGQQINGEKSLNSVFALYLEVKGSFIESIKWTQSYVTHVSDLV